MSFNKVVSQFSDRFRSAIDNNLFVKLTISKPASKEQKIRNIYVRKIKIKEIEHLSFTYRYVDRDEVKNLLPDVGIQLVSSLMDNTFLVANLFSLKEDVELKYNKKRIPKLITLKPSQKELLSETHDKKKKYLIDASKTNIYLRSLGVIDQRGEVNKSMQDKFRQINKFVEVIATLIKSDNLPEKMKIIDFGSGKGYLTFALYDYLTNKVRIPVTVLGIEARDNLVKLCNNIANKASFNNLNFNKGNISSMEVAGSDMVIALHACDTATDDVIEKGIKSGAKYIVVSPCCQKQIRKQMNAGDVFQPIMKYGILEERQAEIVTDGIRALILEAHGYKTNVFEFITKDSTSKNIMITAVKMSVESNKEEIMQKIERLKKMFGIEYHYLEKLLEDNNDAQQDWRNENPVCHIQYD